MKKKYLTHDDLKNIPERDNIEEIGKEIDEGRLALAKYLSEALYTVMKNIDKKED